MSTRKRSREDDKEERKTANARFQPDEKLTKLAKELGIVLRDTPVRGRIALNKSNKAQRSTKEAYNGKLRQLSDFLELTGRDEERFMLLRNVPSECPSITVESCMQFVMTKLEYLKDAAPENDKFLVFDGEYVLDVDGQKIPLEGGWGQTGSGKAVEGFESALNFIFEIAQLQEDYSYPELETDEITKDRRTWARGNPMSSPVWRDFLALAKQELNVMFVSQAREALAPLEQLAVYTVILAKSTSSLAYVMLGVILRLTIQTSFRIEEVLNLTYGSFITALTRLEVYCDELKCLCMKVFGKAENLASDYEKGKVGRRGHMQQVYRNRVDKFVCAVESLLLWVTLMKNAGVETSADSYLFPSASILKLMERGEFPGGPIVKTKKSNDIDAKKPENAVNMVASKSWVSQKLKEVFTEAVEDCEQDERKFGTHTGRKTCILNSLLMGQMHRGPNQEYLWNEVDLDDLCKTVRMVEGTIKTYYVGDNKTYIENVREEEEEYKQFLDYFRPGFVKEVGKAGKHKSQKFHFCETAKTAGSKSIFEYCEKRFKHFGTIKLPIHYYRVMKFHQNWEANFDAAESSFQALRGFLLKAEKFSAEPDFVDELKEICRTMVGKAEGVRGRCKAVNPYAGKKSAPAGLAKKANPVNAARNRTRALQTIAIRDSILKSGEPEDHSTGLEGISKEQAEVIRKDIKSSAKVENGAAEVVTKLRYLRDEYDVMKEWYYQQRGKSMRRARELRADSDFCKRVLKPILLCFEGQCGRDGPFDAEQAREVTEEAIGDFFKRNQDADGKLVNTAKQRIFLTGWEKGCRCVLNSRNKSA